MLSKASDHVRRLVGFSLLPMMFGTDLKGLDAFGLYLRRESDHLPPKTWASR